ncbi:CoA-transferase subunit beta [Vagococcus fluvialis]|uniref:CoA-transferase subunit beta n=1 Tax=Vagococcus fluvialis TaxID=2738 RepID=UPI001D0B6C81|nr:CoA-transferase [Vagococcus fluvialis]UDM71571.1 hypothetical protein K5L00_02070 [Vagococcus fluvialis]UDM76432.1 hypothetical protein K5K98_11870 [Vagococcus fluvialis]UDM83262.1 hypothetical protein K5K96_04550 [Vagococcus fluvialis]
MEQEKLKIDTMICVMARLINDADTVFHGVSSHMPLIAVKLAQKLHAPNLYHLNIPGGVNPQNVTISSYSTAGYELYDKSESQFPLADVFDLSMRGDLDVAFLSGVQFDVNGNVNASVIGDYNKPKVRLPGGAGSAVLIPTVKRAIIWRTKHDKRTFVKKVDFVTTRGNIDRIITPLCVFKQKNGCLVLDSIHETTSIEEVINNTGFALDLKEVSITQSPTIEELAMLKKLDPKGYRYIEL